MDKRGNKKYVNIRGISYVVVDNDYLSPDIPSSTVVLLKKASIDEVNEGEFALVYDGGVAKLKKIIKKDDATGTVLTGYVSDTEKTVVNNSDILAKKIYSGVFFSIMFHIFTNPIVIILLLLFLFFSDKWSYKRFEV